MTVWSPKSDKKKHFTRELIYDSKFVRKPNIINTSVDKQLNILLYLSLPVSHKLLIMFAFTLIMFAPKFYDFLIMYVNHNLWVNLIIFGSDGTYTRIVRNIYFHTKFVILLEKWMYTKWSFDPNFVLRFKDLILFSPKFPHHIRHSVVQIFSETISTLIKCNSGIKRFVRFLKLLSMRSGKATATFYNWYAI